MSDNQLVAQNMTAYTKYRYCKWIDEIPEISKAGTYTLNPVGGSSKENIAYKIKPVGSDEYFVVEYRKKEGFDKSLPGSGLLIYRINPAYTGGNVNYNGTTRLDEQYIFRPNGTTTSDGDITKAFFSARVEELLLVARLQPSPSIAMARRHLLPSATFLLAEALSRSISTNLPTTFL